MRGGVVVTYRFRHAEPQVRFLARASNYERGVIVKCVKRCVSFVLVLLLSSVSLVPCFANTATEVSEAEFSITVYQYTYGKRLDYEVLVPVVGNAFVGSDLTPLEGTVLVPCVDTVAPFLFTEDRTLYWCIYPMLGSDFYGNHVRDRSNMTANNVPTLVVGQNYVDGSHADAEEVNVPVTWLYSGNQNNYQSTYSPLYRATIPHQGANGLPFCNFRMQYPGHSQDTVDNAMWEVGPSGDDMKLQFVVECFRLVDTTDAGILNALDQILLEAREANVNLSNILEACNGILNELKALNADTDTIITLLNTLTGLSQSQLTQLENISSSVDAIYYFLTQELKTESDKLTGEAATIGGNIQNNAQAEDYYQTSMQGSYDSLDLDNFTFGGIAGAMEFVGTVFSDMWSAFGEYTILFTYPMILGIALLVIGRISKHGGGNSSRSSEHKGGEGGA